MKYDNYTVEDYILDEDFRAWVLAPDQESRMFWQTWMKEHPQKVHLVEEARSIILSAEYDEIHVGEEQNLAAWEKLRGKIAEDEVLAISPMDSQKRRYLGWTRPALYRIAAVLIGLLVLTATYSYLGWSKLEYTTEFAEIKTIWLSDSSQVILNANSKLGIHRSLFSANMREVTLNGEAFFIVRKSPPGARKEFIVHSNHVDVTVLGTSFNVNNRRRNTWVVLNTGQVRLTDNKSAALPLTMVPGDFAEYSDEAGRYTVRRVDPEIYTSWRVNQLIFDGSTIQEIVTLMEDTYGFEITIKDAALINRKFKGKFPADRPDILLSALSESFNLLITRVDNNIVIDQRPQE